ncbi:MAG: hypothetical protein IPK83_09445 [Planctomycetes bacterium]|nr:hypothetical protein [Planctomycetota bacterium]
MRRIISILIGLALVGSGILGLIIWSTFRIYVPEGMCAVLVKKTGAMLPSNESVATSSDQRGIQEEVLGPGRHFRDPFRWSWNLVDQTVIPAGDPTKWTFRMTLPSQQPNAVRNMMDQIALHLPKIGVVTRKVGKRPPAGQLVVKRSSGYQGILEEVLTPGTYKLNPYVYSVEQYPATVVPTGFVGVVTNMMQSGQTSATPAAGNADSPADAQHRVSDETASSHPELDMHVRPLADPGQRGTQREVLQPGIYFINPKVQKVTLVEIGFNEYSQLQLQGTKAEQIAFPSDTGFNITVGVTVVWGIDPSHAAEIINEFGNVDGVLDKVIVPQLRSICRNIGSTYAARDFIQGEKARTVSAGSHRRIAAHLPREKHRSLAGARPRNRSPCPRRRPDRRRRDGRPETHHPAELHRH